MCANVGATSRQNQSNIDETQREPVRKRYKTINREELENRRMYEKERIRKGISKQRRHHI